MKLTVFSVTFQKAQFLQYRIVLFSSRWLQPSKQPSALWFQSSPSRTPVMRADSYRFPSPSAYFTLVKLTFSKILFNSIAVRERHLQKRLVKLILFLANVQKRLVKLTPFFANVHFPLVKLTLFLANVQKRLVKLTYFLVTFQKAQFLQYKIVLFSSRWLQGCNLSLMPFPFNFLQVRVFRSRLIFFLSMG